MNNVNVFYLLLISFVIITYPILINTFLMAYKSIINDKTKELILDINIIISLYFIIELNLSIHNYDFYVFYILPLLLSYLYKKNLLIFVITFITFQLLKKNICACLLICLLLSYFILYIFYIKNDKSKKFFSKFYFFLTGFFLTMNSILTHNLNYQRFVHTILLLFLTYLLIKLIVFMIIKSEEILSTYISYKSLEQEKQIRTCLFKMTHEIKNPIAVIKGYLDMFDFSNKKSENYIEIMKGEINRTLNILNDFSNYKNISIKKELMDCSLLMEEIKSLMYPFFIKNNIKYEFKYKEELLVNADYDKIKQVLINLIKNSIEALNTCLNKKIVCKNYIYKKYVVFLVKDNGTGMDKSTYKNAFTPFYTTKSYGTGLGLVLCKEIVQSHHGKIAIDTCFGKGTAIHIYIPINNKDKILDNNLNNMLEGNYNKA